MKIRTKYQGSQDPFVGDRTLWLRSLPVGANVTKATVTLTPRTSSANSNQFLETFTFSPENLAEGELLAKQWGITQTEPGQFIEVDFHTRTTLAKVAGTGGNATLQVDLGGTYVSVADDGTLDPNKDPFPVSLNPVTPVVLPGLAVNKFKLTGTTDLTITKVSIRSLSTNVSVRLGQLSPFWTHLGELSTDDTSPDFATVLNTFLTTAKVEDGFYLIPLIVRSDTIGRLDVELNIDFIIEQGVLPPHLSEIKLVYNYSTLPSVDEALTTLTLPRAAIPIPGRSTAQIIGEFGPSRIAHGHVGEDPINDPSQNLDIDVTVSPECLLAQPFQPGKEIAVTGIDLPLGKTKPGLAGLHLAIQTDADGKPSGEVLTKAEVIVGKPLPNQTNWGSATLPEPFRVEDEPDQPDKRYWLVLQSQVGAADWSATHDTSKNTTGEPGLQCSRDGGFSWRVATVEQAPTPLKALFRLRTVPENFTVPVQLQIGKGAQAKRHRLDEFAPLGRIEFRFDFSDTLHEYLTQSSVASPCGKGNSVVNSDFTQPAADDATRKLFGFDAHPRDSEIIGKIDLRRGVNLSRDRFIVLKLNDRPPLRIDCAGKQPASTQLQEIIDAINTATAADIAFEVYSQGEQPTGKLGIRAFTQDTSQRASVELYSWCNTQMPTGWQGTLGQVFRLRIPADALTEVVTLVTHPDLLNPGILINGQTIPIFPFPAVPASRASFNVAPSLSQRFAVVAGCSYLLQIQFQTAIQALKSSSTAFMADDSLTPPHWELAWLDATNATLRTDSEVLEFATRITSEEPKPWLYDIILNAPAGAVQAELRLIHPAAKQYLLVLEQVTFTPTSAILRNSNFGQWQGEFNTRIPVGWTVAGGWVDEQRDENGQVIGVTLRGDAPEETILIQTVEVVPSKRYELQVHSRMLPPTSDPEAQQMPGRSRIELHWQGSMSASQPVIIPLEGRDFPTYTWVGTAPEGATTAEIRLIQPQSQGNLQVELVSLSQADVVTVPLIFLGEAPGELTVQNLRVAYDLPTPPAPPTLPPRRAVSFLPTRTQALASPSPQPVVEETAPPVPQPVTPPPPPTAPPSEAGENLPETSVLEALEENITSETSTPSAPPPAAELENQPGEDNSVDELPLEANVIPEIPAPLTLSPVEVEDQPGEHVFEVSVDELPERLPPVMRRRRRSRSRRRVLVRAIIRALRKLRKKLVRLLSSLARTRAKVSKV